MKKMILGFLLMVGTTQAQALQCTLNTENSKKPGSFDQAIFNSIEVLKGEAKHQVIVIKPDGSVLENVDFATLKTEEQWKTIDKSIFAVITRSVDNTLAIGTGTVDVSQKENILPMDAMAIGTEGKVLSVMNFKKKLSFSCYNL